MNQIAANPLESWFLHSVSRMSILNIDDETALKLPALKEKHSLGIIVKLPDTKGYTEIILSTHPVPVTIHQNMDANEQLNIQQIVNLVIREIDRIVLPTASELQELLEKMVEQLQNSSEITISF